MNNITIKQGDSETLTTTITNLAALTGYTAKLYIVTSAGVEVDTITGTIATLAITYEIVNEDSKAYPVGTHKFEAKVFDTSDHVYTHDSGTFIVEPAIENDPV
jgi:hypothetical protein